MSTAAARRSGSLFAAWRRWLPGAAGALLLAFAVPAAATTDVRLGDPIQYTLNVVTASMYSGRIDNHSANRSGTLRLELWAFSTPYSQSNATTVGYRLATYALGTIGGGGTLSPASSGAVPLAPPPAGTWYISLFLTEYTAGPYNDGFDVVDSASSTAAVVFTATATVVEYYWPARDHYFITASTGEIAALDAAPAGGWVRTGFTFPAYAATRAGASPVCRFYIPPAYGDSHFFSASPVECAGTQAKFPQFTYEAAEVFDIPLPDTTTGACPAGSIPVYRLFDNRADANHRYTTSVAIRDQMKAKGYTPEGYGPDGVAMCSPQ